MNKQNFRIYYIVAGVLGILFIILLLVPTKKQQTTESGLITSFPTPTSFGFYKTARESPTPSETSSASALISPVDFTGVQEETLPKETSDLITQKQALKKKLPIQETSFTISFNYNNDSFVVVLKEPKAESQESFEQWRSSNYPAIPANRFIIIDD